MNSPQKYYKEIGERYLGNAGVEMNPALRVQQLEHALEAYSKLAVFEESPETAELLFEIRQCREESTVPRKDICDIMERHGIGTKSLCLVR